MNKIIINKIIKALIYNANYSNNNVIIITVSTVLIQIIKYALIRII